MKQREFLRWLMARGIQMQEGGCHIKLYCNGKCSVIPRHPNKELPKGTMFAIKKQLNLSQDH